MDSSSSSLSPGSLLQGGKYKIVKVLGRGGFGITYLGEQTGLGMKVAIKEFFLRGSCLRDSATSEIRVPVTDNKDMVEKCLRKFKSEARKIASLNNDHIVNIIDVFDENGTSYYVMKYLGGGSLADMLKSGPMSEEEALGVTMQICDALGSVHSGGLLHLDIKPGNILFDERGRAVLIDFGVSKYVDSEKDSATTSSLVGFSRGFAPLEQMNAAGSTLTPASDIYALGATLFNLVTGVTPPEASIVLNSGIPELPAHLSPEIKQAIKAAMRPVSSDRPQRVADFVALLPADELDEEEVTVIRQNVVNPAPAPAPKASKTPLIISTLILAAALAFFFITLKLGPIGGKNEAEQYKAQVETLQQKVSTQAGEINRLKSENSTLSQKASSQNQANSSLNSQISTLNSQISTLKKENETLRQKNEANERQIRKLQAQRK